MRRFAKGRLAIAAEGADALTMVAVCRAVLGLCEARGWYWEVRGGGPPGTRL